MLTSLMKIAAPLTLLFALIFLAGAVSAAVPPAERAEVNYCCEKEAEEKVPPTGGECTDPGCGCLSCSASLLFQIPRISSSVSEYSLSPLFLARFIPSPPGRTIDYPPEYL
jgi:hypothetical protein